MQTVKILGFASCLLGLLPLLEPAKAQQGGDVMCRGVTAVTVPATNGSSTTFPVLLNPGNSAIVVCGYSIVDLGPNTQGASLVFGGGSHCAAILGFSGNSTFSATVLGPTAAGASSYLSRNSVGAFFSQGASVCVNSTITSVSVELSYSLQ